MSITFVEGGVVRLRQSAPEDRRAWLQGTLPPGTVLGPVVEGQWAWSVMDAWLTVNHPSWGHIPVHKDDIVPHYVAGDKFRLSDIAKERMNRWSDEFRRLMEKYGDDHAFTAAEPSTDVRVWCEDRIFSGGVGCSFLLEEVVQLPHTASSGKCTCPITALMVTGCRCGGN